MKRNGFTLVEIIVAIALLGAVSVGVMTLIKSMQKGQSEAIGNSDYLDVKREVQFLIGSSNSCKVSLGNPGSEITFNGSSIQTVPISGIELWSADNAGVRSQKKYYSGQKIGKINIVSIELTMPDYTSGVNFSSGTNQSFKGLLTVKSNKVTMGASKNMPDITQSINVTFDTNGAGLSTIKNCTIINTAAPAQTQIRQGFCTPALTPDNANVSTCPNIANYNVRRITGCIPGTQRTVTCCYVPTNADSNGWCSDPMEGHSGCFGGCGANDTNYYVQHLNGVTGGHNDTHTCCFIPVDSTVTKPFSTRAYNSWDGHSGCSNTLSGYNVIETNVVTGGIGNQTACTYVPQVP